MTKTDERDEMTDKELIELAAKGAGYPISDGYSELMGGKLWWVYLQGSGDSPNDSAWYEIWNPLEDDGDALRLAVRIGIDLLFTAEDVEAVATQHARQEDQEMISPWACESWTLKPQDPYAATRRAIVRAAAEIGKGME